MERRVFAALLHMAFLFSLVYGAYAFHASGDPGLEALKSFLPAAVFFVADIGQNILWHFSENGLMLVSQMDPITVFFFLLAAALVLIGVFIDEQERSDQVFNWAFTLATFVAGYEAGKQMNTRRKPTGSPERSEPAALLEKKVRG